MFDKMKQMYELQRQAKEIKKKLESVKLEQTEGGVRVKINGALRVESLDIDPGFLSQDRKEKLETLLCKLFSEAIQEVQKRSASQSADLFKGLTF